MGGFRPKLLPARRIPGSHHVLVRHWQIFGPDPKSLAVRRQSKRPNPILRSHKLTAPLSGSGVENCDTAMTATGEQFSGITSKFYDAAKIHKIPMVGE